jgi:hypothetical protein
MHRLAEVIGEFFAKLTLSGKLISIISGFLIVIIVDSQLGFSYHYFTDRKISEIKEYNAIIKDPLLDSSSKRMINDQRILVINKNRGLNVLSSSIGAETVKFTLSYSWLMIVLILFTNSLLKSDPNNRSNVVGQTFSVIVVLIIEIIIIRFIALEFSKIFKGATMYIVNSLLQVVSLWITFLLSNAIDKRKKNKMFQQDRTQIR